MLLSDSSAREPAVFYVGSRYVCPVNHDRGSGRCKKGHNISTKLVYGSEWNYCAGGNKGFRDNRGKVAASLNSREIPDI